MNPMNIPSMRTASAPGMPVDQQHQAAGLGQAAATTPATNFSHYHVLGDGDCLFRATYMGLSYQPGVEPSHEQVASLRQYLADYVYRHQDALSANPAFEGRQGVMNLYDLLLTPGQWDHNAGDLVAPLLAQVSGRDLAVLQAVREGTAYSVRQVFPAENPSLPPGSGQTGESSICLAHINGNHYSYLEQRYPGVLSNLLNQPREREGLPSPGYPRDQGSVAMDLEEPNQKSQDGKKRDKTGGRKSQLSEMQREALAHIWRDNPKWGFKNIASEFNQRYPEANLTPSVFQAMKVAYSHLRQEDLTPKKKKPKLTGAQKEEVVQLWMKNPSWGESKIAKEYNDRNPGLALTPSTARNMKLRYPGLQGHSICAEKNDRKLSDAQERQLAQLWRQNPHWSESKIAKEYMLRNPEVTISKGVPHKLKRRYPDLGVIGGISHNKQTPLNDAEKQSLAELWLENPTWSLLKMTSEFNKRNPNHMISTDTVYRLKAANAELKQQPVMNASFNASPIKRSEHIQKQLSYLESKMKSIEPLDQASEEDRSRYQHFLEQCLTLRRNLDRLGLAESAPVQPHILELGGVVPSELRGDLRSDLRGAAQQRPAENTPSQDMSMALGDIADFDDLSCQMGLPGSPSTSDADSLAIFSLLDDGLEAESGHHRRE